MSTRASKQTSALAPSRTRTLAGGVSKSALTKPSRSALASKTGLSKTAPSKSKVSSTFVPKSVSKPTGFTSQPRSKSVSRLTRPSRSGVKSQTASSLPTRNSHTCAITKMCLASTVNPTVSRMSKTYTPATRTPSRSYSKSAVTRSASKMTQSKSVSKVPTVSARSKSVTRVSKSGASQAKSSRSKYTVPSCPGTTMAWDPVTRMGPKKDQTVISVKDENVTKSGFSQFSDSLYEDIQYEDKEVEEESNRTCCIIFFWLIVAVSLVLLTILFVWACQSPDETSNTTGAQQPAQGEPAQITK